MQIAPLIQPLRAVFAGACLSLLGAALSLSAHAADIKQVVSATFEEPTSRYNHAVLGPNAEWGALRITYNACPICGLMELKEVVIRLPAERVYEDLEPRIIDLEGDGFPEVVVIESHARLGARLVILGPEGEIAATPNIGTGFRWLAPLGAADLDGDGHTEIAYIDRPHLAKTLRIWRYKDQSLTEVATLPGLTNHKIGEDFISGGIRDCGEGPEIVTADAPWRRIVATTFRDGRLNSRDLGPFQGPASLAAAVDCKN